MKDENEIKIDYLRRTMEHAAGHLERGSDPGMVALLLRNTLDPKKATPKSLSLVEEKLRPIWPPKLPEGYRWRSRNLAGPDISVYVEKNLGLVERVTIGELAIVEEPHWVRFVSREGSPGPSVVRGMVDECFRELEQLLTVVHGSPATE